MTKCKICRKEFQRKNMMHKTCSADCAIEFVKRQNERRRQQQKIKDRKETKKRLEKLKTYSEYIKETQVAFNAYIRERDKNKPCICCGIPLSANNRTSASTGGAFDCGHYRSVGSAPHLRFDERNAHGQRKQCNRYGAGRAVDYRIGLIERIGIAAVESLESDNTPAKWTTDELMEIKRKFKQMKKNLNTE